MGLHEPHVVSILESVFVKCLLCPAVSANIVDRKRRDYSLLGSFSLWCERWCIHLGVRYYIIKWKMSYIDDKWFKSSGVKERLPWTVIFHGERWNWIETWKLFRYTWAMWKAFQDGKCQEKTFRYRLHLGGK